MADRVKELELENKQLKERITSLENTAKFNEQMIEGRGKTIRNLRELIRKIRTECEKEPTL